MKFLLTPHLSKFQKIKQKLFSFLVVFLCVNILPVAVLAIDEIYYIDEDGKRKKHQAIKFQIIGSNSENNGGIVRAIGGEGKFFKL